jgi:hypothetical protein
MGTTQQTNSDYFLPRSSLYSLSGRSSYAEVASKGLEHDNSSKTKKGIKQRQKRQQKRKAAAVGSSRVNPSM